MLLMPDHADVWVPATIGGGSQRTIVEIKPMNLNLYIIPPILSLAAGLSVAVLALLRGMRRRESLLLALVCIWYNLLSPLFILHHLVDDLSVILSVERGVHFFYVYLPVVQLMFFHQILGLKRVRLERVCLALSFGISLFTPTDWYFYGIYRFSWGCISKGGPVFMLFGLYGFVALVYSIVCFISRLRVETNPIRRRKLHYMLISFGLIAVLTLMNIPAINGIDLYPAGTFIFIPLIFLGYGVIRYRLLDVGSMLRGTFFWLVVSVLVLIPNVVAFVLLRPLFSHMDAILLFALFTAWFAFNYLHVARVQKVINRTFNRDRMDLKQLAADLIANAASLKSLEALLNEVAEVVCKTLDLASVDFYMHANSQEPLVNWLDQSCSLPLDHGLEAFLARYRRLIERDMAATHPDFDTVRVAMLDLMDALNCSAVLALNNNGSLVALMCLPATAADMSFKLHEIKLVERIGASMATFLDNAAMFQHIHDLKDRLEVRTRELTQEIGERKRREQQIQTVRQELEDTNLELEKAILQANEMTSKAETANYVMSQEIEERKRMEAALRRSEEKYRLIAENTTDVIWAMDMEMKYTFVSPSVLQLRGVTAEEALEEKIGDVLTDTSQQHVMQVFAQEMERESADPAYRAPAQTMELEIYCKDGSTIWTEVTTSFVRDDSGRPTGIIGVTRDIRERKRAEAELRHAAFHDMLTGLYNRTAFMDQLEQSLTYAERYHTSVALLFLDLDRFKRVNDTYGHESGDRLLQQVASRLKATVRETDHLARMGGDEFTVILHTPQENQPHVVAQRISESLSRPYPLAAARIGFVSASIGIAVYPEDGTDVEALIKSADADMYRNKDHHRELLSSVAAGATPA